MFDFHHMVIPAVSHQPFSGQLTALRTSPQVSGTRLTTLIPIPSSITILCRLEMIRLRNEIPFAQLLNLNILMVRIRNLVNSIPRSFKKTIQ